MKRLISLVVIVISITSHAQNVGIGTNAPKARLHVSDSSVCIYGWSTYLPSPVRDPPISGSGTRMMWYPDKAAFRVGAVVATIGIKTVW